MTLKNLTRTQDFFRFFRVSVAMKVPPRPPPRSNLPAVAGLVAFTGFMCALPVLLHRRHMRLGQGTPMWASDEPLNAQAIRRGAYLNVGSRDVGPDPDWDHKNTLYKGKKCATPHLSTSTRPIAVHGKFHTARGRVRMSRGNSQLNAHALLLFRPNVKDESMGY